MWKNLHSKNRRKCIHLDRKCSLNPLVDLKPLVGFKSINVTMVILNLHGHSIFKLKSLPVSRTASFDLVINYSSTLNYTYLRNLIWLFMYLVLYIAILTIV